MLCKKCGNDIGDDSDKCFVCGSKNDDPSSEWTKAVVDISSFI